MMDPRHATRFCRLLAGSVHYRIFQHPYIGDIWNRSLPVRRSDIVLEVGSGQNPRLRSDILLEKYWSDRVEGRRKMVDERPFVIGDGCNLPFADRSVDYIICRHVLEHVQDPAAMLEEFRRVSRKGGYISTPSKEREKICPAPYHRWYVSIRGDVLWLEEKARAEDTDERLRNRVAQRTTSIPRETEYEWGGGRDLAYNVVRAGYVEAESFTGAQLDSEYAIEKTRPTPRMRFLSLLRRLYRSSTAIDLCGLLSCPVCRGHLRREGDSLRCQECGVDFPIIQNVPVLLPPHERAQA